MDSKLSIILISARTNLEYLKTVFQIAAREFHLNLMTVTRWGWKDFQSRNLLCFPDQMQQEIKYMYFYDTSILHEKNSTERIQILQEFKLQSNKSRGGKQRKPMDLYFCSTSAKKQNQTKTLFFPDTLINLTTHSRNYARLPLILRQICIVHFCFCLEGHAGHGLRVLIQFEISRRIQPYVCCFWVSGPFLWVGHSAAVYFWWQQKCAVKAEPKFCAWNTELGFEYTTVNTPMCAWVGGEEQGLNIGPGQKQPQNLEPAGNSALEFGTAPASFFLSLLQKLSNWKVAGWDPRKMFHISPADYLFPHVPQGMPP